MRGRRRSNQQAEPSSTFSHDNLQYVRGEGSGDARLMIVGEAPAFYEVQEGGPFKGPSGRLLNLFLMKAGINRSSCYLTNLVKFRAPGDRFDNFFKVGVDVSKELESLWDEIREIKPNCILALGKNPLKYLTGRSGKGNSITENRGSILRLLPHVGHECKVVATFHPANLLHMKGGETDDPRAHLYVEHDIKRAGEESLTSELVLPQRHLGIARNSMDTWRYLERHRNRSRVSVDIEVIKSIPVCIGLAFSSDEAISVPLLDFDSPYHRGRLCSTPRDVAQSVHAIIQLLIRRDLEVVGQNFKFDHDKIELRGFRIGGRVIDTMLLHHTLYPEFPKSLEFQTSIHTREPFYKIEGREFDFRKDKLEDYLRYNGRDAAVQYELCDYYLPEVDELGLHQFFFGFPEGDWRYPFSVSALHDLYREMDNVGFRVDPNINKELKKKYRDKAKKIQERLDTLVGGHVNVRSNPQVSYLLYKHLGLPQRSGTGEDVLVALMNSPAVKNEAYKQVLSDILEIRRVRKTISSYLNAKTDFDDRMRTNYKIVGTVTGRTATTQQAPPVRPYAMGMAFQTMTKHGEIGPDLRKQFIVDDGYVFIQADSAQAEARVVFLLARNYDGLKRMSDPNYDIHAHTASWFNPGMTMQELIKDKLRRFTGKKIRHAGHYDMKKHRCMIEFNNDAKKFGLDIQITEWRANQHLETFHANDPSIKEVFHAEVRDALDETKVLISPHGRRREFFGNPDNEEFYKEGYSQLPQATVADNTKRAMLAIKKEAPETRYVLEWHDGFLALVRAPEAEVYGRLFVREMERAIDFSECSLPRGTLIIPCELEISETSYYELRKYEITREQCLG